MWWWGWSANSYHWCPVNWAAMSVSLEQRWLVLHQDLMPWPSSSYFTVSAGVLQLLETHETTVTCEGLTAGSTPEGHCAMAAQCRAWPASPALVLFPGRFFFCWRLNFIRENRKIKCLVWYLVICWPCRKWWGVENMSICRSYHNVTVWLENCFCFP